MKNIRELTTMMKLINLTSLVGPHTQEELAACSPLPGVGSRVVGGRMVVSPTPSLPRAEPGRHKNNLKVWWWWWRRAGGRNGDFFSQRGFASFHF